MPFIGPKPADTVITALKTQKVDYDEILGNSII